QPHGAPVVGGHGGAFVMKLTQIVIDCPGVWRSLTLPVPPNGLSVFYGPNEAGKTTLRQFIGDVLFGSLPAADPNGHSASGSLEFEDASGRHRLQRAPDPGSREAADKAGVTPADLAAKGIDRKLFERIFATGLRGLTELDSLTGEDVAKHLFGVSPGQT